MNSARPIPQVRSLQCPNCGGAIELRGHSHTISAVCIQCLSVLDASTPSLRIVQQFQGRERFQPLLPLGRRGKLWGVEYEAIGFQIREIVVEGVAYRWAEYLLYNPFRGYLYLTEYQGHWNAIRTLRALPQMTRSGSKRAAIFANRTYKHFQAAQATTIYVMGEFPWQARVGETVAVDDYVAPPYVLSSERTIEEVVWSSGTYVPGKEIWGGFSLPGSPPQPQGVYANQPSPYSGKVASAWFTFALLALFWFGVLVGLLALNREHQVFSQRYSYSTASRGENAFVTPVFEFSGRESNALVKISTNLDNDWAFFALALINDDTGVAYNLGREVSYYSGRDSDGAWTEGNRAEVASFPAVPPGRYYLRVEPEMSDDGRSHSVNYTMTVTYGSVGVGWMLSALILLPLPAMYTTIRSVSFENSRWAESDYGPIFKSSSSEEDD
jgi:hypothetical protein